MTESHDDVPAPPSRADGPVNADGGKHSNWRLALDGLAVLVGVVALVVAAIAVLQSRDASETAEQAVEIADAANSLAADANRLSGEANALAGDANKLASDANWIASESNSLAADTNRPRVGAYFAGSAADYDEEYEPMCRAADGTARWDLEYVMLLELRNADALPAEIHGIESPMEGDSKYPGVLVEVAVEFFEYPFDLEDWEAENDHPGPTVQEARPDLHVELLPIRLHPDEPLEVALLTNVQVEASPGVSLADFGPHVWSTEWLAATNLLVDDERVPIQLRLRRPYQYSSGLTDWESATIRPC